ncbi:hypothetical protein [Phaeodactylibacter xiamenensis]|uniref:hypothetical protein n=1 Tax=Phaeodactylibacter xiamenensis TaxID=1524460 RepID=UPI0024A959C7|nr:hypothetical protein [Phaeodactylibacter xiamenensis]
MDYHVVKYTGPFGFIKPWTAVRDGETFSQQFLTPSIIEGMEKKLFPELLSQQGIFKIKRYRLAYNGLARQMEVIQGADYETKKIKGQKASVKMRRQQGILFRSVLLNPILYLAFESLPDAEIAAQQHLCLCRNEDLVYPTDLRSMPETEFEELVGFELQFGEHLDEAFLVGYNRYHQAAPMYGRLEIIGDASQFHDYA